MKHSLSTPTIIFHWLTGLTFLTVLGLGLGLDLLPDGTMGIHKSLGIIVFVIAALRLLWRFREGSISSVSKMTKIQSIAANATHHLLLLATIAMPLSGILMSIGGGRAIDIFGLVIITAGDKIAWLGSLSNIIHTSAVNLVILALVLHVAGALKHQLIDKDGTISRMLGIAYK